MCKNLNDWLSYIETRYVNKIDLGLERIQRVANKLGVIFFSCPVITVTGTNGKGSCVAYLEAILSAAGFNVGSYTSPHLLRFNERICINSQEVDDDSLCAAFTVVNKACQDAQLTYFEFITLTALYTLQHKSLDVLLLEVGLGGRLDAVNIIDADIAVITTIAIDHIDYLGNSREAIGYEKAGIMRRTKPIVCGDPKPPQSLLKRAETLQAPLYCLGREFSYSKSSGTNWQWCNKDRELNNLPLPKLPLQNAATALMVISLLQSRLPVNREAINNGIAKAFLAGRFQYLSQPREIILDVAHNPEASAFLAKQLESKSGNGRTLAVVGMLKDKDIIGTLKPMLHLVNIWYLADLNVSRGAQAEDLAKSLEDLNQKSWYIFKSVTKAYNKAIENCVQKDRIVIFGSFYTVAEVLKRRSYSEFTS